MLTAPVTPNSECENEKVSDNNICLGTRPDDVDAITGL